MDSIILPSPEIKNFSALFLEESKTSSLSQIVTYEIIFTIRYMFISVTFINYNIIRIHIYVGFGIDISIGIGHKPK